MLPSYLVIFRRCVVCGVEQHERDEKREGELRSYTKRGPSRRKRKERTAEQQDKVPARRASAARITAARTDPRSCPSCVI